MNLKLTEEQQLQNSNTQMHQKCGFLFSENSQKQKKKERNVIESIHGCERGKNIKDSCEVL